MYGSASSSVCPTSARSRRVLRVDPDVLVREVGEEDLGLGALAGQPDDVLDLVAATAAASAAASCGTATPPAHTCTPSIQMSNGSGAVPGSAAPTACAMRPQLGSPPCSAALTSGELATARRDALDGLRRAPPCDVHAPDRAPRPRRRARSAARAGAARSRAPRRSRSSSSDSGATITPLAPDAIRIAVSLVESWPSTEMRSNERLTQTPSSRSAVSGSQRRVGLDEAEHRREARLDHPRALGLRADAARVPGRQRDVERRAASRTRRSWRSRARTRRRRPAASSPRAARIAARDAVHRQRHADHAGRRDRDLLLVHAGRHRGGALHARGVLQPAVAGRGVRVAGVDDDGAQRVEPAARLAQQHRRGEHARAREARGADRVGLVADEQREVGIARRLDPGGHAGGAEAGGQPAARDARSTRRGRLDPARRERRSRQRPRARRGRTSG